jgi:Zn finger protein HypA/HybF involved in hydrogenase expression
MSLDPVEAPCHLCECPYDVEGLGAYGCPNCSGEGLDEDPPVEVVSYHDPKVHVIAECGRCDCSFKLDPSRTRWQDYTCPECGGTVFTKVWLDSEAP